MLAADKTRGVTYKIGFIGCGNMARSLAEGMLLSGNSTTLTRAPSFFSCSTSFFYAGQVVTGHIIASATRESSENLKKMKVAMRGNKAL